RFLLPLHLHNLHTTLGHQTQFLADLKFPIHYLRHIHHQNHYHNRMMSSHCLPYFLHSYRTSYPYSPRYHFDPLCFGHPQPLLTENQVVQKKLKAMKIKNKNKTTITIDTIVLTIVVHFAYRHIKNRPTGKKKIKNNTITQVCSYHFSIDSASPIEFLLISFI